MEVGVRGGMGLYIYLSLHCHHQNDSCIKVGSDESYFNVSVIVRDKVTRRCSQTLTFEEKGEPKRNRTEVFPLTSLTPYRWATPAHASSALRYCCSKYSSQGGYVRALHQTNWFSAGGMTLSRQMDHYEKYVRDGRPNLPTNEPLIGS